MKRFLFLIVVLIGFSQPLRASAPCCNVTAVDVHTGTVTAVENATGRTFEFHVANAKLLATLHAGSPVYANFSAKQVSLDGKTPCCVITKITLAPPRAGASAVTPVAPPASAAPRAAPAPSGPCCTITAIDSTTGVVTAKENAGGKIFQFKVTDAALLKTLQAGQGIYANFGARQVSVDGSAPCCTILSAAAAPIAAGQIQNKLKPQAPCCAITAIDNTTGVVTAKENAGGKIFQFKVTDAALLKTLQAGQGIYANFGARQVSVDGSAPCCTILSAAAAPTPGMAPPPTPPATTTSGSGAGSKTGQQKPTTQQTPSNSNTDKLDTNTSQINASEGTTETAIRGAAAAPPSRNSGAITLPPQPAGTASPQVPKTRPQPTTPVFSREPMHIAILSQGKKWRLHNFTGIVAGRSVEEALFQLVGREGITESPIPQAVKDALLKDADASQGNDKVYIVHKRSAEEIAVRIAGLPASTAPSGSAAQTGSSDNGCHDAFGWGNHLTKTAEITFSTPGDLLMLDLNDQNLGPATVSGSLDLKAPMSGKLSGDVQLSILDFACAPVAFKLRRLHINGTMDLGAFVGLDAKLGANYQFKKRLGKPVELGHFFFFIGPIPVYLGFDAFAEGRVDVTVPNLVEVKYNAQGHGQGSLDVVCTMNGCTGSPNFSFNWTNSSSVTLLAQGVRAIVKPGVLGGLEVYLYDPSVINSHIGIEPYVKGDLWAYSGSGCSASKGKGTYEKALTADLDGGFDVLAGIDASGLAYNGFFASTLDQEFTVYNWERHIGFYDLLGSSDALTPLVQANSPAYSNHKQAVTVSMRPCYPYDLDKDGNKLEVIYQLQWGDGSHDSMPRGQVHSGVSAEHTWAEAGQYVIQARPVGDSHGRVFPVQTSEEPIEVKTNPSAISSVKP